MAATATAQVSDTRPAFPPPPVGARPAEFAAQATLVHVDVDAYQLNRVRVVDLPIHAGVRDTVRRVAARMFEGPQVLSVVGPFDEADFASLVA